MHYSIIEKVLKRSGKRWVSRLSINISTKEGVYYIV